MILLAFFLFMTIFFYAVTQMGFGEGLIFLGFILLMFLCSARFFYVDPNAIKCCFQCFDWRQPPQMCNRCMICNPCMQCDHRHRRKYPCLHKKKHRRKHSCLSKRHTRNAYDETDAATGSHADPYYDEVGSDSYEKY